MKTSKLHAISTTFLFIICILSDAFSFTVYRKSKEKANSLETSEDYFTNEHGTPEFCVYRKAGCKVCKDGTCCMCKCDSGRNFYSEAAGCLTFENLQERAEELFGERCIYGVKTLYRLRPKMELPSFLGKDKLERGYEFQTMYPGFLSVSGLSFKCKVQKLHYINVNGKLISLYKFPYSTPFHVMFGSKRRPGSGFKLYNIKLLKFNGTEAHWNTLSGKLAILIVNCEHNTYDNGLSSCLFFNVNGSDSISVPSHTQKVTFPSPTQVGVTPTKAIWQNGNETASDDDTRREDKVSKSSMVTIIIGVVVAVVVILIVSFALFFIKRKKKGGDRGSERQTLEAASFSAAETELSPNTGEYDYIDPDKVRFVQKAKPKTIMKSANPYYESGNAPDKVQQSENILYESDTKPLQDTDSTTYQPLTGPVDAPIYTKCSPKLDTRDNDTNSTSSPVYVDPGSPQYQPLAEREASPQYAGLYKTPTSSPEPQDGESEPPKPDSPLYREVYPDPVWQ